jgi:hypothetical protein
MLYITDIEYNDPRTSIRRLCLSLKPHEINLRAGDYSVK